jgi:corrinoid protein of di/trimethylamine methyltransferase
MPHKLLTQIAQAVTNGEREPAVAHTRAALDAGIEPLAVIDEGLVPGIREAGDRFQCGDYFLPNLIASARAMSASMEVVEPELRARQQVARRLGTVVIGTVKGDIHEIGKSLVATMLAASGFEVHDLGVDVPIERFVSAAREHDATLVGMSALLTTTMGGQRKVIEALTAAGLRDRVKVMVGGAPVSERWAEQIGADGYAEDAVAAVALARRLVGAGNG